jgi:hypothetical protein
MEMKSTKSMTKEDILADDPLRDYFVWWDEISEEDVQRFEDTLEGAKNEHDIQKYLQSNPIVLIQHLGGGHGRYVIPKQRLGSERVGIKPSNSRTQFVRYRTGVRGYNITRITRHVLEQKGGWD